ncbi:MAG: hemagglutinin repeat-containing protein, partial [Variovorax sp.]
MRMRVGSLTNTASGRMQTAIGTDVYGTGALLNEGRWLAGTGGSVIFLGSLTNRATLQSTGDMSFTGATVENQAGASMRADRLTVRATDANGFGLVNAGTVQGDSSLYMNVVSGLWNQAGATLLGGNLGIVADNITNAGTIQLNGASSAGGSLNATNTFFNAAGGRVIALATTAVGTSLSVNARGFWNDDGAALQSDAKSRLQINVGVDGFRAVGDIDSAGSILLAARNGNDFEAAFEGSVGTGDLFAMSGGAGSKLTLAGDKNIVAGSLAINAGTVALGTNAVLQSAGAMTLNVGTLGYDASNRIMASMDAPLTGVQSDSQITLGSALDNNSLLFSGSNLRVSATSITNGTTGGIAALGNLTVTARTGDLMNRGALYAGDALTAEAQNGTLTNAATTTAYQGTIDAGASISLRANTLVNNSTISTPGDIAVQANTIRNEVLGGDTRVTTTTLQPTTLVTSGRTSDNLNPYYDYNQLWSTQQSRNGGGTLPAQITAGGRLDAIFGNFYNLGGLLSGNVVNLSGLSPAAVFTNDSLQLQTITYRSTYYVLNGSYYVGSCALDNRYCFLNTQMTQDAARIASRTQTGATSSGGSGGIYANTLTGASFALVNNGVTGANLQTARAGAPGAVTPATGPGATPLEPTIGAPLAPSTGVGLLGSTGFVGSGGAGLQGGQIRTGSALVRNIDATTLAANAANGVSGLSFGGIRLSLPTNPNGYFVVALEPNARYLVATNANYQITATSVGSDYLDSLLDYSSDQTLMRLGDASYEAYLVKQQLISQTGHDVLGEYQNAGAQMKGLMDSAAQASTDLALTYGQALTPAQQASLKSDVVWMVATEVNGKTVLAPVVYLSAATKSAVTNGTVISAKDANLNLTSLTNTGGTIVGSSSLRVASVGNLTNTSGTIAGGNVALGSSSGSIVNQTTSTAQGTNKSSSTLIGKTAGIEATGALLLSAKKDITNIGAVVSAGGDATLVAGRSITFDTIENKSGSATTTRSSNLFGSTTKRTTTSTVKQVGSELTTGGTLVAQAGKDITFAGTDVKVGGDAALLAGGNVGIVSRENSNVTTVKKSSSGIGVGGSVYGTQKSTQKSTSVRNDASTLNVGGDAVIVAGQDVTVRGSDVNVAGSGLIAATNVNVQAGRDYDETHKRTVTTGFGKIVGSNQAGGNAEKASTRTSTATGAEFGSSAGKGAAQVAAGASAEGGANASGGVALMSRTVRTVDTTDSRNVASNLRFGGDAQIDATGTVTLKGSDLDTAGALGINANRIDVLAGQDVQTSRVQT